MLLVVVLTVAALLRRGPEVADGTGNPRRPRNFSKLVFLMTFSRSYIFLNWLSGALVGVGGSDFFGYQGDAARGGFDEFMALLRRGPEAIGTVSDAPVPEYGFDENMY